jgi:hypothetical protein
VPRYTVTPVPRGFAVAYMAATGGLIAVSEHGTKDSAVREAKRLSRRPIRVQIRRFPTRFRSAPRTAIFVFTGSNTPYESHE